MNIAELFVNLGVKGSDKTVGALTSMRGGLKETASMSLEAKAGILGVMYALEKMFAMSNAAGTGLTNFNATTGVSAQVLQQYAWAAQQVGVKNAEVEGSFRSLQSTMIKIMTGEGVPKYAPRVFAMTGIQAQDIERFAKEPQLLIQKLQEYAAKETNAGLRNEVLKSFGLGNDMIAALDRKAFRPDVMAKAPTYSDGEAKALDKNNAAWANLGTKIEMAFGHFNAKHGSEMVQGISGITDKVIVLAEALVKLGEKAHAMKGVSLIFEGWTAIFQGLTQVVEAFSDPKKMQGIEDNLKVFLDDLENLFDEKTGGIFSTIAKIATDEHLFDEKKKGKGKYQVYEEGTTYFPGTVVQNDRGDLFKAKTATDEPTTKATDWLALPPSYRRNNAPASTENPTPASKTENPTPASKTENPTPAAPQTTGGAATVQMSVLGGISPAVVAAMVKQAEKPPVRSPFVPSPPHTAPSAAPHNVEVNQTLNFQHDGKDAAKTGQSVKKAVKDAYRSQLQGAGG